MKENRNEISDFAHVSHNAILGKNNVICNGVIIHGNVVIGDDNYIGAYTTIGTPPEYKGEYKKGKVKIGDKNTIREYVAIQSPAKGKLTDVGNSCYIMNGCHIAHDCYVSDNVTMAPKAVLGGGVLVHESANIGINACIHPNLIVGSFAMVGMGAIVTKNVPGYKTVANKSRAEVIGWNKRGMERKLTKEEIYDIMGHKCEFIITETAPSHWVEQCKCGNIKDK